MHSQELQPGYPQLDSELTSLLVGENLVYYHGSAGTKVYTHIKQ
jgi:hypothetical protein